MEPAYFFENRYSFVVDALKRIDDDDYEVETPETRFERKIRRRLVLANRLLAEGKYASALERYRRIRGLITASMRPQISVLNATLVDHAQLDLGLLAKALVARSGEMLSQTPVTDSTIPDRFRSSKVSVPPQAARRLALFEQVGIKDREAAIGAQLDQAQVLVDEGDFSQAAQLFETALNQTRGAQLRGSLLHDLAIMRERIGKRAQALAAMQQSVSTFAQNNHHEMQAAALAALAGIQVRADDQSGANQTLNSVKKLQKDRNLFNIVSSSSGRKTDATAPLPLLGRFSGRLSRGLPTAASSRSHSTGFIHPTALADALRVAPVEAATTIKDIQDRPVQLLAAAAFAQRRTQKTLTIVDSGAKAHRVRLNAHVNRDLERFYNAIQTTRDVGLLMGYLEVPTITIAYLTHVYSWVIPMAVGDCLAALGSYKEAEHEYLSTLKYPYLNQAVETVNLWLRLADLYLDWGDRLYRQARNDVSKFAAAREKYENVLQLDNTIKADSPLYKSAKFSAITARVKAAIQGVVVNRSPSNENPRVLMALLRARLQIYKIDNELNFIGLGVHTPPFSFEHLQNLARYFAQHASQVEQMYIQFKSSGENEELREDQMAQQSELAAASVELERRGLDEALEGIDVANANLDYTDVQVANAIALRDQFNSVSAELQELARLQAWAGAASDDEIKLNVENSSYYSADRKPRSHVLFDLANRRAQISNQIEKTRLQSEVSAAGAYRNVAQQQLQQAQARAEVSQQRIAIAQLQQQHAEENLAFLSGREFSSAMWYNLARTARKLTQRYLDMAIEVATLMEKAYEAETGRDLRKIKFEYGLDRLNGLLGAEILLQDIDYFSLDFVRTKSKKAQMKQVISLSDTFPMAFDRLLQTGQTFFETTLDHFDRRYPGFYLQKVKQVELVFVGLNGTEGVHGTLRNIGLSQFRKKSGKIVNQTYPADVMPLSEYDVKRDAIVFQLDSRELRLFENNGIATMWQLDLPLANNTFDLSQILDIQMVLYYDGFFDRSLEQDILEALPASASGARALGLRLYAPDELFFLKSQGSAELAITPHLFPANQTNQVLTHYRIQAVGDAASIHGLSLRVDFANLGASHTFHLDGDGNAGDSAFEAPLGQSLFETWTITIDPEENAGIDLSKIDDIALYVEYDFDYRS